MTLAEARTIGTAAAKPPVERRFERLFDKTLDWPATQARCKYLILSAPRTGGTMLCSALAASGLAGRPFEFLQPQVVEAYTQVRGPRSLGQMVQDYRSRRTSPNGYFGLKMQADQFMNAFRAEWGTAGAAFLRSFDRHIFCYRRDKLNQAISFVLALERQVWNCDRSYEDVGDTVSFPPRHFAPGDVVAIAQRLMQLTRDELTWRNVVASLGLEVMEIAYEDLRESPEHEIARAFSFLGIDVPAGQIPAPTTMRLSDYSNEALRRGFLEAIGVVS